MLYFVATPIGNLQDISFRALETLKNVDIIACEDTRHSLKLLNFYDIKKPLISYHKFNEEKESEKLVEMLIAGKNIAVISDAGMPVISDPGNVLTKKLRSLNIEYTVIPGASAFTSALLLSGLDASKFTFIGFLPDKTSAQENLLKKYENLDTTLIFYSAPQDVNKDLKAMYNVFGDRQVAVIKEITKIYESVFSFNLKDAFIDEPKGEFVIVVSGAEESKNPLLALTEKEHLSYYLQQGIDKKEAIKKVAKERGVNKNEIYKYTIKD